MVASQPSLLANKPSFLLRYAIKRLCFSMQAIGGRPAVTYAAYRTASTSIHHAIRRAGVGTAAKAHMLASHNLVPRVRERESFAHQDQGIPKSCHVGDWAVRLGILEPRREADFVIMVRDPWAVAHSIFVLSAASVYPEFLNPSSDAHDRRQLVDRAEEIIFGRFPSDLMIRWMREDVAVALGWDPLTSPFDADRGFESREHGPWRIQLLRTDISDARKSDALRMFFKRPAINVEPKNGALSFAHASTAVAEIARAAIARRPAAVAATIDGPFCRHFWSDTDRAAMLARWAPATA